MLSVSFGHKELRKHKCIWSGEYWFEKWNESCPSVPQKNWPNLRLFNWFDQTIDGWLGWGWLRREGASSAIPVIECLTSNCIFYKTRVVIHCAVGLLQRFIGGPKGIIVFVQVIEYNWTGKEKSFYHYLIRDSFLLSLSPSLHLHMLRVVRVATLVAMEFIPGFSRLGKLLLARLNLELWGDGGGVLRVAVNKPQL